MISGSCRHHCVHMETAQRETSTVTARIDPALPGDAHVIAAMVGELLHEIMAAVNDKVFTFDHHEAEARARAWLSDGSYLVLLARDGGACVGFLALYQSYALYTEGVFGTIPEFYVRPSHRSCGIGTALIAESKKVGQARGGDALKSQRLPCRNSIGRWRFTNATDSRSRADAS
jgi:GNAT superfamily N-acetyltransferase